jgi:hypothetical protein
MHIWKRIANKILQTEDHNSDTGADKSEANAYAGRSNTRNQVGPYSHWGSEKLFRTGNASVQSEQDKDGASIKSVNSDFRSAVRDVDYRNVHGEPFMEFVAAFNDVSVPFDLHNDITVSDLEGLAAYGYSLIPVIEAGEDSRAYACFINGLKYIERAYKQLTQNPDNPDLSYRELFYAFNWLKRAHGDYDQHVHNLRSPDERSVSDMQLLSSSEHRAPQEVFDLLLEEDDTFFDYPFADYDGYFPNESEGFDYGRYATGGSVYPYSAFPDVQSNEPAYPRTAVTNEYDTYPYKKRQYKYEDEVPVTTQMKTSMRRANRTSRKGASYNHQYETIYGQEEDPYISSGSTHYRYEEEEARANFETFLEKARYSTDSGDYIPNHPDVDGDEDDGYTQEELEYYLTYGMFPDEQKPALPARPAQQEQFAPVDGRDGGNSNNAYTSGYNSFKHMLSMRQVQSAYQRISKRIANAGYGWISAMPLVSNVSPQELEALVEEDLVQYDPKFNRVTLRMRPGIAQPAWMQGQPGTTVGGRGKSGR